MPYLFEFWALPHQLPPEDDDWRTWVILGGRGAGKTRAGAEWVRAEVEGPRPRDKGRSSRIALVGETIDQAREVMVFGESGILACTPPDRKPSWEATRRRLVWPNGAVAQIFSAFDFESLRGPQFDAAWVDEYGCAAVEKGTNQPNKFLDPKSSESAVPYYSTGARDDAMQLAYYAAMDRFWSDPDNNPASDQYEGRMVDMSRAYAWAWDARPFPQFPSARDVWSDGDNYARGHWLTGRAGARSLASVVREVCSRSGVDDVDVSALHGIVRGYSHEDTGGARSVLQPLLMAHGVDAIETGGKIVFKSRDVDRARTLADRELAWPDSEDARVKQVREPAVETVGRLQATFIEADADFEIRAAESILPDEVTTSVARSEVPMVLTEGEAEALVERWLSEARISKDRISFALAPSCPVGAGDVVDFELDGVAGRYRVDRIEDGGVRFAEAVRVDGAGPVVTAVDSGGQSRGARRTAAQGPVWPIMLDLPLITGDEAPHAPVAAAVSSPWRGPVAIYGSEDGEGWQLEGLIERGAIAGQTLNDLPAAVADRWDRGIPLQIELSSGVLSSVEENALFAGANLAAIGLPGEDWEVFQFRSAEIVDTDRWAVSERLRGQRGTRARFWPAGATVLMLNPALSQPNVSPDTMGRGRLYRFGPANQPVDASVFRGITHTAKGTALRPFGPVHLKAKWIGDDLTVSWVRQTRIDGDRWDLAEVPLGEVREDYSIRVWQGADLVREATTPITAWSYPAALRAADDVTGDFAIEVAQNSDRFGPGYFERIEING